MRKHRCQQGAIGIVFTTLVPVIVLITAISVDVARIASVKAELQTAVDFAALGVVIEPADGSTDRAAMATRIVEANVLNATISDVQISFGEDTLTVSASAVATTWMMGLFGFVDSTIAAAATARLSPADDAICVHLLAPIGTAMHLNSQSTLSANCGVQINSADAQALDLASGSDLFSTYACVVGSSQYHPQANADVVPTEGCPPQDDPLIDLPEPTVGACNTNNLTVDGGTGSLVLAPGVHCGDVVVNQNGHLELLPGTHIFTGSTLEVNAGSTLYGEDVTMVMANPSSLLSINAASSLTLIAPRGGPYQGVALFHTREATPDSDLDISFNTLSNFDIEGAIYAPTADIRVNSASPVNVFASSTVLIAHSLEINAHSMLHAAVDLSSDRLPPAFTNRYMGKPYLIQ